MSRSWVGVMDGKCSLVFLDTAITVRYYACRDLIVRRPVRVTLD